MKTRWYKDAVMYQVYPRSFKDSNGDGIGDLNGIIEKLDYIRDLGVKGIWMSPVYKSPNDDNGYDISDYTDIMDDFGTLNDWKKMIAEIHKRKLKLVMDLVVNHTSDEHEWFKKSRESKDNPYRDYYIWRKGRGKDGKKPPNNWTSRFTGKAWEYDEKTEEWYLHLFSKKQPDLNWNNPKVREEVAKICKYWFDLGVDGFRCDVITYIGKKEGLPNGKFNIALIGDEQFTLIPETHEYLKELNRNVWSKYDTLIVGEAIGVNHDRAESLIDEKNEELDSAITFEHMDVDMKMSFYPVKLKLPKLKKVFSSWQNLPLTSWPSLYYENHDQPRSVSRYGNKKGEYREELAKMLAVSLHFQRGTPYVYQGQEIGMTNIKLKRDEYIDIMATRVFTLIKKIFPPLLPIADKAMAIRARDHARTPMQWNSGKWAGFSEHEPWMKVNPNFKEINVEAALKDEDSILNFYKKLIKFRNDNDIIINGAYNEYNNKDKNLFVYERALGNKKYFVICNFKDRAVKFVNPGVEFTSSKLILSNYKNSDQTLCDFNLSPYEARVYELTV